MKNTKTHNRNSRPGYAVIILLVMGLAIYLILQLVMVGEFRLPGSADPNLPWNQFQFASSPNQIPQPTAQQVDLSEQIKYNPNVRKKSDARGELKILVQPDGLVAAEWQGNFWGEKKAQYDVIGGQTAGHIDPEKPFINKDGNKVRQKLYFFTRGDYAVLETDHDEGHVRTLTGSLYVEGWINPDKSAFGNVFLVPQPDNYKVFTWTGKPEEPKNIKINGITSW
jgi:hypothetical protein